MPIKRNYEARDIGKMIESKKTQIRRIRHIQKDDEYYNTSRERILGHVQVLLAQVVELDNARCHGDHVIERLHDEIEALELRRTLAIHRTKMERLLNLENKIDDIAQTESEEV